MRLPLFQSSATSPTRPAGGAPPLRESVACSAASPSADLVDPPAQQIADRRLPGLDAVIRRHDRSRHDAADAGNVRHGLGRRRDGAVARGGADDLHERSAADARADGAVVRVEAAHRNRNSGAKAEGRRPFGRRDGRQDDRADTRWSYKRSRSDASFGCNLARNSRGGSPPQASPYRALCPAAQIQRSICRGRSTPARTDGTKSASSTQLSAASNTSAATFRQCQIFAQNHSDEYVPPIGASRYGACSRAVSCNRGRLGGRGVVLPEPRLCGGIRAPARIQRQRPVRGVHRQRRRSGRVHADADHARARKPRRSFSRCERARHGNSQGLDVVGRILPREVRIARRRGGRRTHRRDSRRRQRRGSRHPRSRRPRRGRSWCRSRCRS